MRSDVGRRTLLLGGVAATALAAMPAWALTTGQAQALIDRMVREINAIINSGASEGRMFAQFEDLFARYADVPTIAASALGPAIRSASRSEQAAYVQAFQGYIARKYGRRFREFVGSEITVQRAEPWKSHHQVFAVAQLRGEPPFSLVFRVSDRSGRDKFFDMLIEGISLLKSEGEEIRAMYDARGRDIGRLIAHLQRAG